MLKTIRTYLGEVFRDIFPKNFTVSVKSGPLKGLKWLIKSGNSSYFLGNYEPVITEKFEQYINSGDIVYDIGAHVGYYSLIASKKVGNDGYIYAFEPLPRNLSFLYRHCSFNDVKNIKVMEAAVSFQEGIRRFAESKDDTAMGHLSNEGEIEVKSIVIDKLIEKKEIKPANVMKIDVEGMEYWVLKGAENLIKTHKPTIFLATHGTENYQRCQELLKELGYELTEISNGNVKNSDFLGIHSSLRK